MRLERRVGIVITQSSREMKLKYQVNEKLEEEEEIKPRNKCSVSQKLGKTEIVQYSNCNFPANDKGAR